MGVIVNKNDELEDQLSRRIRADLRGKATTSSEIDATETDFTESEYTKDLKKTSKFGWVWFVLIFLAILSLVSIFLF